MDTPNTPESPWERLERLLEQQPERDRQHEAFMAEIRSLQHDLAQMIARRNHREALERGEDVFYTY